MKTLESKSVDEVDCVSLAIVDSEVTLFVVSFYLFFLCFSTNNLLVIRECLTYSFGFYFIFDNVIRVKMFGSCESLNFNTRKVFLHHSFCV